MADCSRPPHCQPRSVFGFRSKGAYDDVFVSRPKMRAPAFTPGVKDYAEIFNCSKPSSIPVLDLEEFHRKEVDDELMVDYGNVFGGFSDAKLGFAYEDVFSVAADGVGRKASELHSNSRGTARFVVVEDSQKLPHESLWEKKLSSSSAKIIRGGKGAEDGTNGLGKISEVPVPARTFDGIVPPKKESSSKSDTTTNSFKRHHDELQLGKHSTNVSSSGLPTYGGDGFIEIDKRSGSDKSVSSDTQMETNIITPNVQMFEATAATDSSLHLGGSVSTYSDVYRPKNHGEGNAESNKSSEEGVLVRSIHGLDNLSIGDTNEDESVIKHYAIRSHLSPDLTHEHSSTLGTSKQASGAKGDSYCNSLRDVKFQDVNGSSGSSIKYFQDNASDGMPHERFDLAPAVQSQQSFGKMDAAFEGAIFKEKTESRSFGSESAHMDPNGHLSNGVDPKNEVEHVEAAKRKTSMSKIDVSNRSTNLSANNSPSSSDDDIDKHSEASAPAAAVRKAIKEAQALINVAKESDGVKGFMNLAMTRKSGPVKVAKEEQNSKVNEDPKFFGVAQSKIQNSLSASVVNTARWPIGSEMKMASADTVIEGSNLKGTEFSTFSKPDQMKAVEMPSSLRKKTQEYATTQHAPLKINSFPEKLAVYSSTIDQKFAPIKEDVSLSVADSAQIRIVHGTDCSIVPNVEKRETEVNSASQEAFLNNSPESPRKEDVAFPFIDVHIRIIPEADCSSVPNVEKGVTKANSVGQEVFLNNSPESCTVAEKESQKTMNSGNQGFMVQNFSDNFVKTMTGCSVDSFEVKQDVVAATNHIHISRNEAMNVQGEGHAFSDLTSLEEENVEEPESEPHDHEFDCEDTDSQDYASAEENWVLTDTEDVINDEDHIFSAKNNLDEIAEVVIPEVTVISEVILPPSLNGLHDDQIAEQTDGVQLHNILMNEAPVSDEKTASVVHYSVENPVAEETDKSDDISWQPTVTRAAEVISEEVTSPVLNEDLIVEETNVSENEALDNMLMHEVKFTSEETTVQFFNYSDEKTAPVVHDTDENPVVEVNDKSDDISLRPTVTLDAEVTSEEEKAPILNEDLIVEETNGSENGALNNMNMLMHEVKFTSEVTTLLSLNYSDEDPMVEEADVSEGASVLVIAPPRAHITSEYGASSSFNIVNRDTVGEIKGTVDMTGQTMVNHGTIIFSKNDTAPFYDESNEDQIVEDDGVDKTSQSSVGLQNEEHDEGTTGAAMLHEQINHSTEMLDCVARIETESAFCDDPESLQHEGSDVELSRADDLSAASKEESISTHWTFEPQNQEIDDKMFCDPDPRVPHDREDLPDDAGVKADATEEGGDTMNVEGFENDNATVDAASMEESTETDSTLWNSEHLNSELEAEVQNFEPLPDSFKYKETTEVEQLSEEFLQQVDRHERRKWDISRETFELPELEIGATDIQDTLKQDSGEIERQMDRHERKKWEIPSENFELPVLGAVVVAENEENARHHAEGATQLAEKPERKKWKIQKDEFEVPIICAEAVADPSDHEGFVIKTPSAEEMGLTHNKSSTITFLEEVVQHEEVHDEFSANAKAVPGEAASSELCSKNSEEEMAKESVPKIKMSSEVVQHEEVHDEFSANAKAVLGEAASSELCSKNSEEEMAKESVPKIKMSSEEEPCKHLGETSDQQYSKVGEGNAVEREGCMQGTEDVDVKDEIKRTLGMLWKKIYNIKQDGAFESVQLTGSENVNVNDTVGQGIGMDLNLKGPVQLVESPRQQDDTELLNFSCNRKESKGSLGSPLYTESFELNESREFVPTEIREVQRNSPLAFDSCKFQEGEKRSGSEETENYNGNHLGSQSEEALSGSESENSTEMTPTHETCDLKKEGNTTGNYSPSNVYEHREMGSETVSGSKRLMVDETLVDNAESSHKTKVLQQDGLNDVQDENSDENISEVEVEVHHVDDLSDKRSAGNEQHDRNTSRQNMKSISDSDVHDFTPSHGFEQRTDKKETCTDKIEQPSSWKWIFGDEFKDKCNEQDESPDEKNLGELKGKTKETTDAKETADYNDINHVSGKVEIDGDKPTLVDYPVRSRMHKEATPGQEGVKNITRTKELERIAVERAIREARERAFIEARERAAMERANAVAREISAKEKTNLESRERIALEKANAQVRERAAAERAKADLHQKVNSDGHERLQRTSSEAKLASERNSLEAKRKAELERAAVERATTEARQRALEKAMSRKERVTDSSSRSASTSIDQYGSASKESLDADKPSESALRFRARNERHQRIAERAAKALAEKNMRDLLVQREQAERNRLAEVLDADVKRWARGKTGNLRALLSTLQYILGPDSGWQAIHLTEIVTADAVKKAYRKATLFVHPDKLQQRGATIRQKYICEKVFDLLKEAWNKFDRDER